MKLKLQTLHFYFFYQKRKVKIETCLLLFSNIVRETSGSHPSMKAKHASYAITMLPLL